MVVVSKQCLYVLSHVSQAIGKYNEAIRCLDQIEVHLDEERQRDDGLYNDTMKQVVASDSRANLGQNISSFALEGKSTSALDIESRCAVWLMDL